MPICKSNYFVSILTVITSYQVNDYTGFIWKISELIGMKNVIKTKEREFTGECVEIYQVKMKCYFRCLSVFCVDLQNKY